MTHTDQWTELEKLAKAATQGIWRYDNSGLGYRINLERGGEDILAWKPNNLKFVAASNPQVILHLIALARSEAVLREALEKVQWFGGKKENPSCPACHFYKWSGRHDDHCSFQALVESDRLRCGK